MQKSIFRRGFRKVSCIILALCCGTSLCAIISEPSEGTPMSSWLLWEAVFFAVLVICAKCLDALLSVNDKSRDD